jgi:hypothetical protein
MRRLTMYSRATCGLCDEARHVVETVAGQVEFAFEEVFIDGDDRLEREYGLRVPVLLVDGEEAFETVVDGRELLESLRD